MITKTGLGSKLFLLGTSWLALGSGYAAVQAIISKDVHAACFFVALTLEGLYLYFDWHKELDMYREFNVNDAIYEARKAERKLARSEWRTGTHSYGEGDGE